MLPIFDGHNDTLLSLTTERGEGRSFFERSSVGHVDLPRALEGGFVGGFFAIFVPKGDELSNDDNIILTDKGYRFPLADPVDPEAARAGTQRMMNALFELEKTSDGKLEVVRTVDALEACLSKGVLAAILHFEGAEVLEDAAGLEAFYNHGLRSLGLVWSRPNSVWSRRPLRIPRLTRHRPRFNGRGQSVWSKNVTA